MWFTDKSAEGILQHSPAHHDQELCRAYTITCVKMINVRQGLLKVSMKWKIEFQTNCIIWKNVWNYKY